MGFEEILEQKPKYGQRQKGNEHIECKTLGTLLGQQAAHGVGNASTVLPHHRQNGCPLDHDHEHDRFRAGEIHQ